MFSWHMDLDSGNLADSSGVSDRDTCQKEEKWLVKK